MQNLVQHGLKRVGEWVRSGHSSVKHLRSVVPSGINYVLPSDWRTRRDLTYAFVFSDVVAYVGETTAGMASRFDGYRYGNPLETDTDNRVKLAITEVLNKGQEVSIWASQPVAQLQFAGGCLDVPASKPLEERLIGLLSPGLNVKNLHGLRGS